MPRKSRQEKLSDYIEKVDKCENWRDQENFERTWRRLIDLYRGKHWPSTTSSKQDLIAVNLAFSRVNVIAPSIVDTPLANRFLNNETKVQKSAEKHPLNRVGNKEDIAEMISFLLSDKSSWMTGQILNVDGGLSTIIKN